MSQIVIGKDIMCTHNWRCNFICENKRSKRYHTWCCKFCDKDASTCKFYKNCGKTDCLLEKSARAAEMLRIVRDYEYETGYKREPLLNCYGAPIYDGRSKPLRTCELVCGAIVNFIAEEEVLLVPANTAKAVDYAIGLLTKIKENLYTGDDEH